MPEMLSDDIGSFPLPAGVKKEGIRKTAAALARGEARKGDKEAFVSAIEQMMEKKVSSGIQRPNYPQMQDMVSSFNSLIQDFPEKDQPFLIQEKHAVISEMLALDGIAKQYHKEKGEPLMVRVCATGPLELYLKGVGANIQADLLLSLGKSIGKFFRNNLVNKPHMKTALFSLDEPGLGLNPSLYVKDEDLIEAFEAAVKPLKKKDVEIHLHSVNSFDVICQTEGINVIGIEYAENPKALDWIDRSVLDSYDKSIRLGIARTNISALVSEYAHLFETDLWKTKEYISITEHMETVRNIKKRLSKAYSGFDERIRYAGPDCGLGAWPSQDAAEALLRNTSEAVKGFNSDL